MEATRPADVATGYLRALGGDDPDAVIAFVADDFRNEHFSALGSNSSGRDEYRRRLPGFMEAFKGRRYAIEAVVEQRSDDADDPGEVVVRYRLTAESDGTPIDIPGMMWITVEHGLITRRIDSWDSLTFLRQTGAA